MWAGTCRLARADWKTRGRAPLKTRERGRSFALSNSRISRINNSSARRREQTEPRARYELFCVVSRPGPVRTFRRTCSPVTSAKGGRRGESGPRESRRSALFILTRKPALTGGPGRPWVRFIGEHREVPSPYFSKRDPPPPPPPPLRYVGLVSARCPVARCRPGESPERHGTHRPGGEVSGRVRLQPGLGPHGHRARHLGALGKREGGVFRGSEHEPRTVRDEQPDHGHLLRPGRTRISPLCARNLTFTQFFRVPVMNYRHCDERRVTHLEELARVRSTSPSKCSKLGEINYYQPLKKPFYAPM